MLIDGNNIGTGSDDLLIGTTGDDTIEGLGGNDTLLGLAGNDVLRGGADSDKLQPGAGDDFVDGGAGFDHVIFEGITPVLVDLAAGRATGDGSDTLAGIEVVWGSAGDDTLLGDDAANGLHGNSPGNGGPGNDSLSGRGGDDLLEGGMGNDTLTGGPGEDAFQIDTGLPGEIDLITDLVTGDALCTSLTSGTTLLFSGGDPGALLAGHYMLGVPAQGMTRLFIGDDGIAGADRYVDLVGSFIASDFFYGSAFISGSVPYPGDYWLYDPGAIRSASILGSGGADTLHGEDGNDTLVGLGGDDLLVGNVGRDSLVGGDGNDTLRGGPGANVLDGGAGFDVADYSQSASGLDLDLATGTSNGEGTDTLIGIEAVRGSAFADTLVGSAAADALAGGPGNDTLTGGAGNDVFDFSGAAPGDIDRILDFQPDDVLYAGTPAGSTWIAGGVDPASLPAGAITVGAPAAGFTRLFVGLDTIAGADFFIDLAGSFTAADFAPVDEAPFGQGFLDGDAYVYAPGARAPEDRTGTADANFIAGGAGDDALRGMAGNDTLYGAAGNDWMVGDEGDDLLRGSSGNDTVRGGAGTDTLLGGTGNDLLQADADGSNDVLDGGSGFDLAGYSFSGGGAVVFTATTASGLQSDGLGGTDTLVGIEGESITGSEGADVLAGSALSTFLRGSFGDDTLTGGGGDDQFDYSVRIMNGVDLITDLDAGDKLTVWDDIQPDFVFRQVVAGDDPSRLLRGDVMVGTPANGETRLWFGTDSFGGADITVRLQGTFAAEDFAHDWYTLTYEPGRTVIGTDGNDVLTDGWGGDLLIGLAGNDALWAWHGDDTLQGGSGDDFLDGGLGADLLDGGDGYDAILYTYASLPPVVVTLGDGPTQTDPTGSVDTLVGIERIDLVGSGGADVLTGNSLENHLSGGGGADTLAGGGGNDTLTGGDGADVFAFGASAQGIDVIADFGIADVIRVAAPLAPAVVRGGNGVNLGAFGVQARIGSTSTTFFVDTDGSGGTDLQFELQGLWRPDTFEVVADGEGGALIRRLPGSDLQGMAYHWKSHVLLEDVIVRITDTGGSGTPAVMTTSAHNGTFAAPGLPSGSYALSADRTTSDAIAAVTSADALAALRIAVGINPNPDEDGAGPLQPLKVSPYQFIAADANEDGRITSADALAILRMAVRSSTAPQPNWSFVQETRDLWNETAEASTLTRTSAAWDHTLGVQLAADATVNLVGVLRGDVNGSWSGGPDVVDLDMTQPTYFNALATQLQVPTDIWGL